jgi:hypothetical protein
VHARSQRPECTSLSGFCGELSDDPPNGYVVDQGHGTRPSGPSAQASPHHRLCRSPEPGEGG